MPTQIAFTRTESRHRTVAAIVALVFALLASAAGAQVYRVTDEHGNVVFTDRPQSPSATTTVERIELPETNSAPSLAPQPAPAATPTASPEVPSAAPQVTVAIVSPANETTIAMGPGNFNVSATTDPPLARQEQLQLLIDGQPQGEPQRSSSWFVEGAMRGEHDLRVVRLNAAGNVIAQSEDVRVYVLRPSILRR